MNLGRAFVTVSGLTAVSRVLGFLRDILFAAVLGTSIGADAFLVAFKLPNFFRRLFAEGAFNAAFVPMFAAMLEGEGRDRARRLASEILAVLLLVAGRRDGALRDRHALGHAGAGAGVCRRAGEVRACR